jgi:hypothetical protein
MKWRLRINKEQLKFRESLQLFNIHTELRKVANPMGANNKRNNNKTAFPKH